MGSRSQVGLVVLAVVAAAGCQDSRALQRAAPSMQAAARHLY